VWNALVYGFGGLRDHHGRITFDPRLPQGWSHMTFPLQIRESRLRVHIEPGSATFTVEDGGPVEMAVRRISYVVAPGEPVVVTLADQGPRRASLTGSHPVVGGRREDGSVVQAIVPESHPQDGMVSED
jgi:alpha,alpha-trehalose phosphorylase